MFLLECWPRDYSTVFVLNSAEHEFFSVNEYENAQIVCICIFISREIFMLSYV